MPITKLAKKALRQDKVRTARNVKRKKLIKDLIKKTLKAVSSGDPAKLQALWRQTQQAIDKAAKRGVIKKNKANRQKSRLAAKLSQTKNSPAVK